MTSKTAGGDFRAGLGASWDNGRRDHLSFTYRQVYDGSARGLSYGFRLVLVR